MHSFFVRISNIKASIVLNFSDFEPRNILKLFSNTKVELCLKGKKCRFQSVLIFYYIIKLSKGLYFVSIRQ